MAMAVNMGQFRGLWERLRGMGVTVEGGQVEGLGVTIGEQLSGLRVMGNCRDAGGGRSLGVWGAA